MSWSSPLAFDHHRRVDRRRAAAALFSAAATSALLLAPSTARAATATAEWLAPVSGNWTDATKLSTNPNYPNNGAPAPGDSYHVHIDAAAPKPSFFIS